MKPFKTVTAVLLGAGLLSGLAPVSACAELAQTDAKTLRDYTEIMVSMVNDARVEEGLSELYIAPVLNGYADTRAKELTEFFSHERPAGKSHTLDENGEPDNACFTVMKDDGFFYNYAAENIAAGNQSPAETFNQYMNSAKHRKNIMTNDLTHIGIGYVFDPTATPEPDHITYQHYWSMLLIASYDAFNTPVTYEGQYIPERELGDADGSKVIDSVDAVRIMQYSAKRSAGANPQVTDAFWNASDVNGDGKINAIDASIVLRYSTARGADSEAVIEDFIWQTNS